MGIRMFPLIALAGLLLAGCGSKAGPSLRTWATPTPAASPEGSFAVYTREAEAVEASKSDLLTRTAFYPAMRSWAIAKFGGSAGRIRAATARRATFAFNPRAPFAPIPHVKGWNMIGRVMEWEIEDAVASGNYDVAISHAIAATRFGLDLTGGAAIEANLGFTIADNARAALRPAVPRMSIAQLRTLSQGMKAALDGMPDPQIAADHEGQNMLMAVDYLQDAASRNAFDELKKNLYEDGRETADYLAGIRNNAEAMVAYFNGLGEEAVRRRANDMELAALSTRDRANKGLEVEDGRLWRRSARQFFGANAPLRQQSDRSIARTRILILTAEMERRKRAKQPLMQDTRQFSGRVRIDPYTGADLLITTDGIDYKVYSVGEDLIDNGGESDPSGLAPDLLLEPDYRT